MPQRPFQRQSGLGAIKSLNLLFSSTQSTMAFAAGSGTASQIGQLFEKLGIARQSERLGAVRLEIVTAPSEAITDLLCPWAAEHRSGFSVEATIKAEGPMALDTIWQQRQKSADAFRALNGRLLIDTEHGGA